MIVFLCKAHMTPQNFFSKKYQYEYQKAQNLMLISNALKWAWKIMSLKVHKIEFCLASILKFVLFLYKFWQNIKILHKKFSDWASIGGGTIFPRSLKTTRNEKKFELGQKCFVLFFSFMNPLCGPILVFPKFDPLTASGMALCVDLGPKCQNLFCLVSD